MDLQPEIVIIGIGVLLVLVIMIGGFLLTRREEQLSELRFENLEREIVEANTFVNKQQEEEEDAVGRSQGSVLKESRKIFEPLNQALGERKFGKTWRLKLARANLKLTVIEFALLHVATTVGFFVGAYLIMFQGDILMSTVSAIIGFFAPRIYVGRLISQRLIDFETQLPDTLGLWTNALRSGYSVLQAMEAIARDAAEPTKTEFQRVVKEVQIGIDTGDALDHLLERVESPDLDLVITAVNIQREVGGNLAEILEVISGTIRERIKLKGEIRVLTSQGRITGYLISFLPIVLALFLNGISPGYMGLLFEDRSCGWPMLGAGLALIGIGTAIIQKIVDIQI